MSTPLSALSNILSSGIATIESTYAKHGTIFPSMDEPFQPTPFEEDEVLCQAIDHVIAAASQLIALVKPAPRIVVEGAFMVRDHICRWEYVSLTCIAQVLPLVEPSRGY
jgi:hypothetical protein